MKPEVRCFKDDAVCDVFQIDGRTIYRCRVCGTQYLGVEPDDGFAELFEQEVRDKLRVSRKGNGGGKRRRKRKVVPVRKGVDIEALEV